MRFNVRSLVSGANELTTQLEIMTLDYDEMVTSRSVLVPGYRQFSNRYG